MTEKVRLDDQFRDNVGQPIVSQRPDALALESDEVPDTYPTGEHESAVYSYTVAAKAGTADLSTVDAITIPNDNGTVTGVVYTPAGDQAAPSSGNSRSWVLAGSRSEGTIASFTFDSESDAFVSGAPVDFTVGHSAVSEETLTLASTHEGTAGARDPGGTLAATVQY